MKITKSQFIQFIKEEMENVDRDGDADDQAELDDMVSQVKELVDDFDIDPPNEGGGFFLTLVRESGNFLGPREQELADQMRDACVQILLAASSNAYKGKFPSRN